MRDAVLAAVVAVCMIAFIHAAPLPAESKTEDEPAEVPVVEKSDDAAVSQEQRPAPPSINTAPRVPDEPDYDDYEEDEYGYGEDGELYDDEVVDYDDYDDEDDEYYEGEDDAEGVEYGEKHAVKRERPAVDEVKAERKQQFDAEYQRYLDEMMEAMKDEPRLSDEIVRDLEEMGSKSPLSRRDRALYDLAKAVQDSGVRSELDEQERMVVERMRRTQQRRLDREDNVPHRADDVEFGDKDEKPFRNLDERAEKHLRNIVEKRVRLMDHIDQERKEAFVQHMMQRELAFREEMAQIEDPQERKQRTAEHEKEWEVLRNAKGNQPGHQKQLEEVWRNEDGMGGEFNPEVFFALHDLNMDHQLDIKETEALFLREARALHAVGDHEPDMTAVYEEMARMREAVMAEVDTNKDDMISKDEFMALVARPDFKHNTVWKALVPEYTSEQMGKFNARKEKALRHKDRRHIDHRVAEAARRHEDMVLDKLKKDHKELADNILSGKDLKQRHLQAALRKAMKRAGQDPQARRKAEHIKQALAEMDAAGQAAHNEENKHEE